MKKANKNLLDMDADPLPTLLDGKSPERISAEVGLSPVFVNSQTASLFADGVLCDAIPRGEAISVMARAADKVKKGDLSECEATLAAQALTLDAMFNSLARKAARHMHGDMRAVESCLRLALKAQGQCRATLQTLAEMKNPHPIAFVKQANIAHGHQQINNGIPAAQAPHARAREENQIQPNELLETHHGKRLDTGAASTAGGIDSHLEALAEIDRAAL